MRTVAQNRQSATLSFRRIGRAFFAVAVLAVVAACQSTPPDQKFPELTFSHLPAFHMNTGKVEVVSKYQAPLAAPNVDHEFPTPPAKAMANWAKNRLKADGTKGRALFTILDASVTENNLDIKKGFKGAFYKEQSERYQATVEAMLEIFDAQGKRLGVASAKAQRSKTVREDITLRDREKMWFELTEALMGDFNTELERNIRKYLANWFQ